MITPLDIQNKEFKKSIRGYNETEVDEFLDEILKDYEKLYKENMELKDKILLLNEQIEKYNSLEHTLKETLIVAQSTADEVIGAAKKKANSIIESANVEAKRLIDEANNEVYRIRKEYEHLVKEMLIFKTRYKSFIEAQLTTLEEFYSEMEKSSSSVRDQDRSGDYINKPMESFSDSQDYETEEFQEDVDQLGA